MSIYLGNNLLAGAPTSAANIDGTNITNTFKSDIAGYSMPSDTYDDLTLGASGSTYIAPANGYFVILADLNTSPCYLAIYNTSSGIGDYNGYAYVSGYARGYVPVKRGDIIQIDYTSISNMRHFRFYYAVGSESEAS